ncbi:MAG: LemA family protein, partial [Bacilli bacterium]
DLKANKTFIKLQNAAVEVEENLQAARRFYNGNVRMYNRKVIVFPSNLVARHRGFGSEEFFEAEDTSRGDVDENF